MDPQKKDEARATFQALTTDPHYRSLKPEQQRAIRKQWWDVHVGPHVPKNVEPAPGRYDHPPLPAYMQSAGRAINDSSIGWLNRLAGLAEPIPEHGMKGMDATQKATAFGMQMFGDPVGLIVPTPGASAIVNPITRFVAKRAADFGLDYLIPGANDHLKNVPYLRDDMRER